MENGSSPEGEPGDRYIGERSKIPRSGTGPDSVRALYQKNGFGHLIQEGHAHYAEAVARRFYLD